MLLSHVRFVPIADIVRLVDFCRYGGAHVVCRQGATDAFELKFANWFDAYCILNRHQDPRTNQDLPGLGFVAEPRCDIGYRSDGGVIETSLKANRTERRKAVRNTDTKTKLMSQPTPFVVNDPFAVRISRAAYRPASPDSVQKLDR